MAVHWLNQALEATTESQQRLGILEEVDWSPPKKTSAISFSEGDSVKIGGKHRGKYLEVYGPEVVEDLVVQKVLPSGEIAVRHGRATPFIVAKSHLERRVTESQE